MDNHSEIHFDKCHLTEVNIFSLKFCQLSNNVGTFNATVSSLYQKHTIKGPTEMDVKVNFYALNECEWLLQLLDITGNNA